MSSYQQGASYGDTTGTAQKTKKKKKNQGNAATGNDAVQAGAQEQVVQPMPVISGKTNSGPPVATPMNEGDEMPYIYPDEEGYGTYEGVEKDSIAWNALEADRKTREAKEQKAFEEARANTPAYQPPSWLRDQKEIMRDVDRGMLADVEASRANEALMGRRAAGMSARMGRGVGGGFGGAMSQANLQGQQMRQRIRSDWTKRGLDLRMAQIDRLYQKAMREGDHERAKEILAESAMYNSWSDEDFEEYQLQRERGDI